MLQPFPYDMLWNYSEKFTRDTDLREDLVLMAWQQDKRFGDRSKIRLLKSFMKFRAKEISSRNSLGKSVGGKSKRDAYSQPRVSIFKKVAGDNQFCLADTLTCVSRDPLGTCIVNEFQDSLHESESLVAEQIVAGYNDVEGSKALHMPVNEYRQLKALVRENAVQYLA